MATVAFKKGLAANLPSSKVEGTIYVTSDERAVYLDLDGNTRIRIGNYQEYPTVAALALNANPSTSALYYIAEDNVLARWNGDTYETIVAGGGWTAKTETTAYWSAQTSYIPAAGALIVYSDYATVDGNSVPNFKVGDGLAYVVDLPFVGDDLRAALASHMADTTAHITAAERAAWNNKVSASVVTNTTDYTIVFSNGMEELING